MTEPIISIDALNAELLQAYAASGMDRGRGEADDISWVFGSNPQPFAVARQGDAVVGLSAYIRSRMKVGAINGTGLQAVDSFVSETMRGKGIFTQLARAYDNHAEETGADLVWGFPNDNAAPAWFGKLGWFKHGQVPFLIKPLRSGYFFRKLRLGIDFPLTLSRDQKLSAISSIGAWGDVLWDRAEIEIGCAVIRDRDYLSHRLFGAPHAAQYRTVADTDLAQPALFATREAEKHGGQIAYVMEALGGSSLAELLMSELGRLRERGVELVLAWSFPWSPNYRVLRKAGFMPLPERLRPIHIWFGSRPKTLRAELAKNPENWYLSYLDSDTV